jgi:hypothetical protein
MKEVNCPYIRISEKDANLATNTYSTYIGKKNFESFGNFSFVSTANAQQSSQISQQIVVEDATGLLDQLSVPFYLFLASCLLFVILMSVVYIYHWLRFSLNDPFIRNFAPIYFFGLIILTIPLVFNLIF